jgi:hypothetical protein
MTEFTMENVYMFKAKQFTKMYVYKLIYEFRRTYKEM